MNLLISSILILASFILNAEGRVVNNPFLPTIFRHLTLLSAAWIASQTVVLRVELALLARLVDEKLSNSWFFVTSPFPYTLIGCEKCGIVSIAQVCYFGSSLNRNLI